MKASRARSEPQASGKARPASEARSEAKPSGGGGAGYAGAVPARARAALAVAAVLFALEWVRPAPPPADCRLPGERRAEAGHTAELTCGGQAPGHPVRGPARRLVGLPIDPNQADAATLETLPGVGPARALAILEARRREPFRRVEDLEKVPGIGPRTLAGMAGALAIGGEPRK